MSTVQNGHPIVSQLHAPITASKIVFQLDIPALAFILSLLQRAKYMWGAHSNEQKLDMNMVSELQVCLAV
jgi:hypothetical protein